MLAQFSELTKKWLFKYTLVRLLIFSWVLLFLCRLAWYISVYHLLPEHSWTQFLNCLFTGLYFDTPVLGWFFLPVWVWLLFFPGFSGSYPRITAALYTLSAASVVTLTSIDLAYSRITGRRSGTELLDMVTDTGNKISTYLIDYWWGILLLVCALYIIYRIALIKGDSLYILKKGKPIRSSVLVLSAVFIWLTMARGGWKMKPLVAMDASEYVGSGLAAVAGSTPLQFISTFGSTGIDEFNFMTPAEAEALVIRNFKESAGSTKQNVVLLIVESLGRDYTGFLNGQKFTPFLDSLSEHCINFRYCYANGIRSAEMIPSIYCGIPSIISEQFITSPFATNRINNAYYHWGKMGYHTSFFHGGQNGTMRFQSFLAQTGMTRYYGLNEYPPDQREIDYDGNWGIFDEPYLKYFKKCIDTFPEPFFTSVFTLSSHHPFSIPEKWQGKLPRGKLPIHQAIAYTDASLRSFFDEASKAEWFGRTIFVITADHTSNSTKAYFYSETGHYEIPLLIYIPGKKGMIVDKTVSQCDIIPTLEDITGNRTALFGLGRSAFDSTYKGYSLHHSDDKFFIVHYPYTLGMNGSGFVTDYYERQRNDTFVRHLPKRGEIYQSMLRYLQGSLQVYSDRMNKNIWFYPQATSIGKKESD